MLRGILNRYVDKIAMEDMPHIKVPDEKEHKHFLETSEEWTDLVLPDLIQREKDMPKGFEQKPGDDSIIAIYSTGRNASVDSRLYGGKHANVEVDTRSFNQETDKVEFAITHVGENLKANPNGGQLIFLDNAGHSLAKEGRLPENIHKEMKTVLMEQYGLKATEVAIINGQELTNPKTGADSKASGSKKDERKFAIAEAYNAGKIKVVIGTTASMGEGMDLQVKTTDIWHLDIPYKPGDYRQRNGRGVRYGNENDLVNIHYLFMRGTYDNLSFNTVINKRGWNEAIWDKDVADEISTEEEMVGGGVPEKEAILIEMETDPRKKAELIVELFVKRSDSQLEDVKDNLYALNRKRHIYRADTEDAHKKIGERKKKLAELKPDSSIKNATRRKEQFEKSKAHIEKLLASAEKRVQTNGEAIDKLSTTIGELDQEKGRMDRLMSRTQEVFYPGETAELKIPDDFIGQDSVEDYLNNDDKNHKSTTVPDQNVDMDFPSNAEGTTNPRPHNIDSTVKDKDLIQSADVIKLIKKHWPALSIRGKATHRKKTRGWYQMAYGQMRLQDVRDVDAALHELGHHFDRQMGMWSKSTGLPSGIPSELIQLGKDLYGDKRPANGYRAEGFAEFIRGYLTGDDMRTHAPKLYDWFTTEYLPARPKEAKGLRELEHAITALRNRSPEQVVRLSVSRSSVIGLRAVLRREPLRRQTGRK